MRSKSVADRIARNCRLLALVLWVVGTTWLIISAALFDWDLPQVFWALPTEALVVGLFLGAQLGWWAGRRLLIREQEENELALATLSGSNPTNGAYVVREDSLTAGCPMCGTRLFKQKACQPGSRKPGCLFPHGHHLHLTCDRCHFEWLVAKQKW
jgi:hypothetical protein